MFSENQIHKELDLIQDIIKRMADNCFKVKAWFMAILGAVIALSKDVIFVAEKTELNQPAAYGIGIFLIIIVWIFWYLDGFFLQIEKKYRELYKWVVDNRLANTEKLYNLNDFNRTVNGQEKNIIENVPSILCVMFSKTLWPFYLLPLIFVVGLLIYNVC